MLHFVLVYRLVHRLIVEPWRTQPRQPSGVNITTRRSALGVRVHPDPSAEVRALNARQPLSLTAGGMLITVDSALQSVEGPELGAVSE